MQTKNMQEQKETTAEKRVEIPANVEVSVESKLVKVKGPKGGLEKNFSNPQFNQHILIGKSGNEVVVSTGSDKRKVKAIVGTIASHVRNMCTGVTAGYRFTMKAITSHFPVTIEVKGEEVHIKNFLGEKGARIARIRGGCKVRVQKDSVEVEGISVDEVGQTAANIEQACRISKKDRRIFIDGVYTEGKFLQNGEKI